MQIKDLVPWSRGHMPASHPNGDSDPFFALHREMNRLVDNFFRSFDLPSTRGAWSRYLAGTWASNMSAGSAM